MTRELTHGDVSKILEIVDGAPHLNEIEFVHDGFHFHFQRGAPAPSASRAPTAAPVPPLAGTKQAPDPKDATVRAPLPGTFCRPSEADEATAAVCEHGFPFTAVMERGGLMGVQFHPEKSGAAGAPVIANFLEAAR